MTYILLAKHDSFSFINWVVVSTYEGITLDEVKEKAKVIYDLNKDRFKSLELKLFEGNFLEMEL